MSGHGRAEAVGETLRITVEIRSVNHRFCRVSVRTPTELSPFEEPIRRQVQDRVQRGKVDVTVSVTGPASAATQIDQAAAAAWAVALRTLAHEHDLAAPSAADVALLPGVVGTEAAIAADDATAELLRDGVGSALDAFDEMRQREGKDLSDDMIGRVGAMRDHIDSIAELARELPARVRDQLRERITELLEDTAAEPDADRIVQEAAHLAERADVTEEIVRLRSHLDKAETLLRSTDAVGRTLEFVTQEIHRELNTIGSKTKDLEVTDAVVGLKAELERLREQVQNVE